MRAFLCVAPSPRESGRPLMSSMRVVACARFGLIFSLGDTALTLGLAIESLRGRDGACSVHDAPTLLPPSSFFVPCLRLIAFLLFSTDAVFRVQGNKSGEEQMETCRGW